MRSASPLLSTLLLLTACSTNSGGGTHAATSGGTGGTTSSSSHSSVAATNSSVATTTSTVASTTSTVASTTSSSSGVPFEGGIQNPCQLPGSIIFKIGGSTTTIPGGDPTWPDLTFLHLPAGFCAHYYGTVGDARQMRFAPGGELFVASPGALSTGGNAGAGMNAIVVLPDYNQDGVGDSVLTFLSFPTGSMGQGMLFAPGFFYYQDGTPPGTKIKRLPYNAGDLKPSGSSVQVADLFAMGIINTSSLHWVKAMDMADDGTIYVGNGSDQGEACIDPHKFVGGIFKIDPAPGGPNPNGAQVAKGFRNPSSLRCAKGHNRCFATELALDYSAGQKGREKLIAINQGDDWGYPCCATKNTPYTGVKDQNNQTPDCSTVQAETNAFLIGDTPFGVDFEAGNWPAPFTGNAFVATHGAAGSWVGARVVAIPMDGTTGLPQASTNINGQDMGMIDFATGWDDATLTHGRPAAVTFSPDGRLFVADDNRGVIFWIAPAQ